MRTLLIVVVVIGLAASVGPIVIGSRSFDGEVADSPYERGLDWDKDRTARERSAIQPHLVKRPFRTGVNEVGFLLDGPEALADPSNYLLKVTRPHTDSADATYTLHGGDGKKFLLADVEFSQRGAWDLLLHIGGEETEVVFTWRIQVNEDAATAD